MMYVKALVCLFIQCHLSASSNCSLFSALLSISTSPANEIIKKTVTMKLSWLKTIKSVRVSESKCLPFSVLLCENLLQATLLQMSVWTIILNCNITTTFKQEIAGVCQPLKPFRSNFGSGNELYSAVKFSFLFFSETTSLSFLSRLSRVRLSSAAEIFRVRSQADASSAEGLRHERRVGQSIDLTETGNRAWKVASTQGTLRLACARG